MRRNIYTLLLVVVFSICGIEKDFAQDWQNLNTLIQEAGSNATMLKTGYYKLYSDVTIQKQIYPGDGIVGDNPQNVIVDLNGYTITVDPTVVDGDKRAYIFQVDAGETLTIQDSSSGKTGKMTGGKGERGGAIHVVGTLNFEGGTITGCKTVFTGNDTKPIHKFTNGCGGAIYIQETGRVYMRGTAKIENCSAPESEYNTAGDGQNEKVLSESKGGAVFVDAEGNNAGNFEMSGDASIKGCSAGSGGAVYLHSTYYEEGITSGKGASFKMYGNAKIEECSAKTKLGKNYVYTNYRLGGGGVFVSSTVNESDCLAKASFEMSANAKILNNAAGGHGAGVLVLGTFVMNSESSEISGNYPHQWNKSSNLQSLYFGGGVFVYGKGSEFSMTGGKISGNTATSGGGIMAWTNSVVVINGENSIIEGNAAKGTGGYGNGGGLFANVSTVQFKNGTFKKNVANRYGGAINIDKSSTLSLEEKCIITENKAGHGGGLSQESGECTIEFANDNIIISNNEANGISSSEVGTIDEGHGGGVYIEHGKFTMSKGSISNNKATGNGGGVALRMGVTDGSILVDITGGNVNYNIADSNSDGTGKGGGLDIYGNPTQDADGNSGISGTITVNLSGGEVKGNKAYMGGGVNIYVNPDNSTANLYIGTENSAPYIVENLAENGGGISMASGNVKVTDGYISSNNATEMGGGLYVVNNSGTDRSIVFDGGLFERNKAKYGAGVSVNGKVTLTLNGTIEGNEAVNGGGIYLTNGSNMIYTGGLIRNNKAVTPSISNLQTKPSTAYNWGALFLEGTGGGIFLDTNTELTFSISDGGELGIYGNLADFAADDIFANGNTTSITLPDVTSMQLKEFNVPTTKLFWAEDYVKDDTYYEFGSKKNQDYGTGKIHRYRTALANPSLSIFEVPDTTDKGKYLCLALGYENIVVTLKKTGLRKGESAVFTFTKDNKVYAKVMLTGKDENGGEVSKTIALTAGEWTVTETLWSWAYNVANNAQSITKSIASDSNDDSNDDAKVFAFTNSRKESIPPTDEDVIINQMMVLPSDQ